MKIETPAPSHRFDDTYYKSGAYAEVSFARFSQYWCSNRFYARLVCRYGPPRGKVLEVGVGLGHLLSWLTSRYEVYGTDINAWAIEQAAQNVPQGKFVLLDAQDQGAFENQSFQIVVAKHVVEHLPEPERAIGEMSRVLAPGGSLLLATPNLDSLMRKVKKESWIGYKDKTHTSLKPPQAWLDLLKKKSSAPQAGIFRRLLGRPLPSLAANASSKSPVRGTRGLASHFGMEYHSGSLR